MLGVAVNFVTVIVGGILGTLLKGGIPEKYRTLIQQGLALCVMLIGITGAIETENTLGFLVERAPAKLLLFSFLAYPISTAISWPSTYPAISLPQ